MEHWLRQLLTLLASIGWLLSLVILIFIAGYYLEPSNPLRSEGIAGATIPIIFGFPVWFGLVILIAWKWSHLSKREIYLSGTPVVITLLGYTWSILLT